MDHRAHQEAVPAATECKTQVTQTDVCAAVRGHRQVRKKKLKGSFQGKNT